MHRAEKIVAMGKEVGEPKEWLNARNGPLCRLHPDSGQFLALRLNARKHEYILIQISRLLGALLDTGKKKSLP
jgi:hypothetical protein